jgi:hypothetical protein
MKHLINENLPLALLVILYVCVGYFLQEIYALPKMMTLHFFYVLLVKFSIVFSCCFIIIQSLRGRTWDYINLRSIVGFLFIFTLFSPFASTFSSIKQVIPQIQNFSWDQKLMEVDYFLHFGNHPWRLMRPLIENELIIRTLDLLYMLWFIILFCFCLWMAWSKRRMLRLQFFICTSIVWMVFGSLLGTIFSSAGPCYYSKVVAQGFNPYQPLMNNLYKIHDKRPLWAISNQLGVWDAYVNNEWLPFGGISAMPSIHVAMAVVFALLGMHVNRFLGIVLIIYAIIIYIGSVVLGWHYAVDGYLSSILVVLLWKVTGKRLRGLNKKHGGSLR